MKIEHLAIWTSDLETLKSFYVKHFGARSNEKYHNPTRQFSSYFLSFESGCRLELMQVPGLTSHEPVSGYFQGLAHFAISAGSKDEVDRMTEQLRQAGQTIKGEPRWTGDGYYESVVFDPDGNTIEITI